MAAAIIAVPAVWVSERLVNEDGFVSLVAPLADDQQVKDYMVDEITAQVVARAADFTPGTFTAPVEAVIRPVARQYVDSDGFKPDLLNLVRQQHAWLFTEPAPGTDRTEMQFDITGMVNRVLHESVPRAPTITGPIVVPLSSGGTGLEAGAYERAGRQITAWAWGAVIVAILAAIGALLIAVRRGTVLAWLGGGLVLSGVSAWAVAQYLSTRAKDHISTAEDSSREVAELFIDRCADDLTQLALIVGAVGAVIAVVGVVLRMALPRHF